MKKIFILLFLALSSTCFSQGVGVGFGGTTSKTIQGLLTCQFNQKLGFYGTARTKITYKTAKLNKIDDKKI